VYRGNHSNIFHVMWTCMCMKISVSKLGAFDLHKMYFTTSLDEFYKMKFINRPCCLSVLLDTLCLFIIGTCALDDITLFSRQSVRCVGDAEDIFVTHKQWGTAAVLALSTSETEPLAAAQCDPSPTGLPAVLSANIEASLSVLDASIPIRCISSSSATTHTKLYLQR